MNEAVSATQVHKRSEIAQARYRATYDIAFHQFSQKTRFLLLTPFLLCFAFAEDQTTPFLVHFDDLDSQDLVVQRAEGVAAIIAARAHSDKVRGGDKPFQTVPAYQHTTTIVSGYGHFHDIIGT